MSFTVRQTAATAGAGATSITLSGAISAGDFLYLIGGASTYSSGGPYTISAVSDNVNGSWTVLDSNSKANLSGDPQVNASGVFAYFANSAASAGGITITITATGNVDAIAVDLGGAATSTPIVAHGIGIVSGTDTTNTLAFTSPSESDTTSGSNWVVGWGIAYFAGATAAGTNGAGSGATFDAGLIPTYSAENAVVSVCHLTALSSNGSNSVNCQIADPVALGKCLAGTVIVAAAGGGGGGAAPALVVPRLMTLGVGS